MQVKPKDLGKSYAQWNSALLFCSVITLAVSLVELLVMTLSFHAANYLFEESSVESLVLAMLPLLGIGVAYIGILITSRTDEASAIAHLVCAVTCAVLIVVVEVVYLVVTVLRIFGGMPSGESSIVWQGLLCIGKVLRIVGTGFGGGLYVAIAYKVYDSRKSLKAFGVTPEVEFRMFF